MESEQAAHDILGSNPYYKLVEELKDFAIFLVDTQGLIASWNEGARRLFGYGEAEAKGQHFRLVFTPEDVAGGVPEAELERARANGRAEDVRWHQRKDGSRFFVSGVTTALINEQGHLQGFAKVARDETPRKLIEDELYDTKVRLQTALAAGNVATWVWDIQRDKVMADNNLARLFSMKPEEAKSGPISSYLRSIHPDDARRVEQVIQSAIRSQKAYAADYRVVRPDGSVRWVEARGRVDATNRGQPAFLSGAVFDITERKEAEAAAREIERQFEVLADSISQLAWMADVEGNLFWYNQRWYDYTGTNFEQMKGWGWRQVHDPEWVEEVTAKFQHSVETGELFEMTFPLRGQDGQFRWFLTRALPIRDASGNIVRWFGTNTDIEEIRQARQASEEANRLKDEFLSTLSHELRTPLNAVLGWAYLLRTESLDAKTRVQALETIERNARGQSQIIDDILDISRIISGKVRLDLQQVNLAGAINGAVDSMLPTATTKGIEIKLDLDPQAGLIAGDTTRLQQIIWNLLSNAIKFTPKGGGVSVGLARVESYIQVSVADTGKGIAPNFLPHIFDRFRQADSSSTRQQGGLGLGLAIVRQLMELHGGTIEVESGGLGNGTTFRANFPLAAVVSMEETPEVVAARLESGLPPARLECPPELVDLRVLVVDDEPDARILISTVLKKCGVQVSVAASVREALQTIETERPDVLVSDIGMPEQDGYELIQLVRRQEAEKNWPMLPAIALTAFARPEDRMRALRAGFQTHVSKPVEPTELLMVVAALAHVTRQR